MTAPGVGIGRRLYAVGGTCGYVALVAAVGAVAALVWADVLGVALTVTATAGAVLQWTAASRAAGRWRRAHIRSGGDAGRRVGAAVEDARRRFGIRRRRLVVCVSDLNGRRSRGLPLAAATSGAGGGIVFVDAALVAKAERAAAGSSEADEVDAVVAHEVAHVAGHDVAVRSVAGLVATAAMWCCGLGVVAAAAGAVDGVEVAAAGVIGVVGVSIVERSLSRRLEYRADAGAAAVCGSPEPLARALERDFSGVAAWWRRPWASHPSTEKRCARLRAHRS